MVQGDRLPGGEEPLLPDAHLQPGKSEFFQPSAELARLHEDGFSADERAEAEEANARLETLLHDENLVQQLRKQGFQGPEYQVFNSVLASYGFTVVRAWIRRGEIFQLIAKRNRAVTCPSDLRAHLASPAGDDDRQELALETVAVALQQFRRNALISEQWSIQGGASLNTFFAGACILAFPNVFRHWRRTEYQVRAHLHHSDVLPEDRTGLAADPAVVAVRTVETTALLDLATDLRVRQAVVERAFTGQSYAAIAEEVGMSEDALKQGVSRFQRKARGVWEEATNG